MKSSKSNKNMSLNYKEEKLNKKDKLKKPSLKNRERKKKKSSRDNRRRNKI